MGCASTRAWTPDFCPQSGDLVHTPSHKRGVAPLSAAVQAALDALPEPASDDPEAFGAIDRTKFRTVLAKITNIIGDGPRARALRDLRVFTNHRPRLRREREAAASGYVCAKRAGEGALRPWNLGVGAQVLRRVRGTDTRVIEAVCWALAAEKTFKRRGIRATHAQWAAMLGCSLRTAGATIRAAVAAGYLTRSPWFSPSSGVKGGPSHTQRECCYQLSDELRTFLEELKNQGFARSLLVGKDCQPQISRVNTLLRNRRKRCAGIDSTDSPSLPSLPTRSARSGSVRPEAPEGRRASAVPASEDASLAALLARVQANHEKHLANQPTKEPTPWA